MSLLVNPQTERQLSDFIGKPSHGLLLLGPSGSGKFSLAQQLAENLLNLEAGKLVDYGYQRVIEPDEKDTISIEAIRELEHFLSLKVPGSKSPNRAVIITHSQAMTPEAQNALLKTLEEPPAGTILILTAGHAQSLLPTIRSRVQLVNLLSPSGEQLLKHFEAAGFATKQIQQSHAISGGLPGLMTAMLNDEDHPLHAATELARQLLGQSIYERLCQVDSLAKQRQLLEDTLFILQQMAHVALQSASGAQSKKWQQILTASYEAKRSLAANGQTKLVLIDLMLAL
ncbi:MAG TPA: AAA family ATPase [Candidatus Saccharimonadales bacterium]|nr:AAA family ATPase [Candidatus Saccharimonadales bacterium]